MAERNKRLPHAAAGAGAGAGAGGLTGSWKPEKLHTWSEVDSLMTYVGAHDGLGLQGPDPGRQANHSAGPTEGLCGAGAGAGGAGTTAGQGAVSTKNDQSLSATGRRVPLAGTRLSSKAKGRPVCAHNFLPVRHGNRLNPTHVFVARQTAATSAAARTSVVLLADTGSSLPRLSTWQLVSRHPMYEPKLQYLSATSPPRQGGCTPAAAAACTGVSVSGGAAAAAMKRIHASAIVTTPQVCVCVCVSFSV